VTAPNIHEPLTSTNVVAITRAWLEQVVIGLNLCPFAQSVHQQQRIDYQVSVATDEIALMNDLIEAIEILLNTDPEIIDTTLLIHPWALQDFGDYNEFIGWTTEFLSESGLEHQIQIASFHPEYQFADTTADDITNNTNRSPFPTLHILRESSVDEALTLLPDAAQQVEKNLDTLRNLGKEGWDTLIRQVDASAAPKPSQ
jgi:hypothetical protein